MIMRSTCWKPHDEQNNHHDMHIWPLLVYYLKAVALEFVYKIKYKALTKTRESQ